MASSTGSFQNIIWQLMEAFYAQTAATFVKKRGK